MSDLTNQIYRLIEECTEEERVTVLRRLHQICPQHPIEQLWGTTSDAILTAIARSPDLTQRGIRGILAEAVFEEFVIPLGETSGWHTVPVQGDRAFDFLLRGNGAEIRIQVKLQRKERGVPKQFSKRKQTALGLPNVEFYVVEVQKTRSGEKKGISTRPYRFGDFDILAVNLHPATGDWRRFMYTVGRWLLPRPTDPDLIEIFQPVPSATDAYWTDDIQECIMWFLSGQRRRIYET